jgi:hypothetical protein
MRSLLSLLLALLGVSGCAPTAYWHKPSATNAQAASDDDTCRQESSRARRVWIPRAGAITREAVDQHRYRSCMEGKGYEWVGLWPVPGSSRGTPQGQY